MPGILWLVVLVLTIYLFNQGKSRFIYFLSLLTLIVMYVFFTNIGTGLFAVPLENMYDRDLEITDYKEKHPIVVLGGGIVYGENDAYLSAYSLQRTVKGYELYRQLESPMVLTGGVAIGHNNYTEAEVAAEWLVDMGINSQDIIIEDNARTTYENGKYVREWLLSSYNNSSNMSVPKVYLVTHALHLPRSVQVFENFGIEVIPVNAGILVDHRQSWLNFLPNRGSFSVNMMAVHEWLGLVWYKITGRI